MQDHVALGTIAGLCTSVKLGVLQPSELVQRLESILLLNANFNAREQAEFERRYQASREDMDHAHGS